MSYLEEKFAFDDDELIETATHAVNYARQSNQGFPSSVTPKQLIDDLFESVCMLQKDGLQTAFVHRSFQEYFAAVFATNLHGEKVKQFVDKSSMRFVDSVLVMAADMSRELIEKEFVLPTIQELEDIFWGPKAPTSVAMKTAILFDSLMLIHSTQSLFGGVAKLNAQVLGPLEAICSLYPRYLGSNLVISALNGSNITKLRKVVYQAEERPERSYRRMSQFVSEGPGSKNLRAQLMIKLSPQEDWWLIAVGQNDVFEKIRKGFSAIKRDIQGRDRRRASILDEFL